MPLSTPILHGIHLMDDLNQSHTPGTNLNIQ